MQREFIVYFLISSLPIVVLESFMWQPGLTVIDMIKRDGYPLERHRVTTEDGYILELHRIPYGRTIKEFRKPPILFLHGVASSSADWVNAGRGRSLAYELADLGHDVWLGNFRGNQWGRNHISLNPDVDKEFWNYSFHELGIYDLPAIIDFVLATNGAEKLFYIAHSQGTSAFFVMTSKKPEYNKKIILMTAFAPVAFMKHIINPTLQFLSHIDGTLLKLSHVLGLHELIPHSKFNILFRELCSISILEEICKNIFFFFVGYDHPQLKASLLPTIFTNLPSGTSGKEGLHLAQTIKYGTYRPFDYYSEEENIRIYGSPSPPDYNLTKITTPIALHYGQNDWLSSTIDVERLRDLLPNVVVDNKIEYADFNHGDFLWATDVFNLLYKDVINIIQSFTMQENKIMNSK